jgi:hypothetical protein
MKIANSQPKGRLSRDEGMTTPKGRLDGMQSQQGSLGNARFLAVYGIALKNLIYRFDRFSEPAVVPWVEPQLGH